MQMVHILLRHFLTAILSISVLTSAGTATQTQEEKLPEASDSGPTIRAVSESVILDIVVRDDDGRPVKNLALDEVEVFENGIRQTITSFRFAGEQASIAETSTEPDAGDTTSIPVAKGSTSSRTQFDPFRNVNLVAFVFERLPDTARDMARRAAFHFLETGMRPNTLIAVFAIDNRLYLVQHFTNKRDRLEEAISHATSGAYGEFDSQASETIQGQIKEESRLIDTDPPDLVLIGGPGERPEMFVDRDAALAQITLNVLGQAQRLMSYQRGHQTVAALQALVHEEGKLTGRKTLVLFSAGIEIPPEVVPRYRTLISQANRANVSIYSVDARGLVSQDQLEATKDMLDQAIRASRRQMLTGYGRMITREEVVLIENAEAAMRMNAQGTLDDLARSTGGFLVANTNDPRTLIERVSEDVRAYYEVSYTPTLTEYDGRFRSVEVRILRPDVDVQSRSGYFAVPPATDAPVMPFEIPMLVALNSKQPPTDFRYRNRVLRFGGEPGWTRYVFVTEVPLGTFTYSEDEELQTYQTRFSLLTLVKDDRGRILKKFTQDYPLQGPLIKANLVKAGSVIFMREYDLSPGHYTVESAVVDHFSQRLSTKRVRLVVVEPDNQLSLSSLSVIRRVDPAGTNIDQEYPFFYQGSRIIPNLSGTILSDGDEEVGVYCVVYPSEQSSKEPEMTLELWKDGKTLARGKSQLSDPDELGQVKFVGTLPIAGLNPGRYEVKAVVQQGNAVVEEHAFFTMAILPGSGTH
jgi:VWFA-related protein